MRDDEWYPAVIAPRAVVEKHHPVNRWIGGEGRIVRVRPMATKAPLSGCPLVEIHPDDAKNIYPGELMPSTSADPWLGIALCVHRILIE